MPTIRERKGAFTVTARVRGIGSKSATFSSRDAAVTWGAAVQQELLTEKNGPLLTEKQIRHLPALSLGEDTCGVYFLYKGEACVYVGQGVNVHRRVLSHIGKKDFDVYRFISVAKSDLSSAERYYIDMLRPALNHVSKKESVRRKQQQINIENERIRLEEAEKRAKLPKMRWSTPSYKYVLKPDWPIELAKFGMTAEDLRPQTRPTPTASREVTAL